MDKQDNTHQPDPTRRRLLAGGLAVAATGLLPTAYAEAKVTNIIVPFTPGGPTDIIARVVADNLSTMWKSSVVVQNKAGAGGSIGAAFVARSEPDGTTLLLAASSHVMSATLLSLPYDPVNDFITVAPVSYQPFILCVNEADPIKDFKGFLAELKDKPGAVSIGSAGIGNGSHLAALLIAADVNAKVVQVPYSGSSQLNTALLGGQVRAAFINPTIAAPLINSGKVRGLAVTSTQRWRQFPGLPTVAEMGFPGFESGSWYTYLAPKGTPKKTVEKLYHDIHEVLQREKVKNVILDAGMDLMDVSPAQFQAQMKSEYDKWAKVLSDAGLNKTKQPL
jgi:tripartite-type tricarboxylate transporter receptor subunit TctC